jgi:hypothetical protein
MSAVPQNGVQQQPAPQASRVKLHESFFALFGGPLAWYVQLCVGYALASKPCFWGGDRLVAPPPALHWTWAAMILAMAAAVAVALLSLLISWRAYQRTHTKVPGDVRHLIEVGSGRTRFLALWGMLLGGAFALATTFTAVAFLTLPRCAG